MSFRYFAFVVVMLVGVLVAPPTLAGKIFVNHDEWTLSNHGFSEASDTGQFALNIASWFTSGTVGNFLVYSTDFALTETQLASTMTGAGHSWTVSTSVVLSLPKLLQYDGIFLAGNSVVDNTLLIEYIQAGGNVYLAGGTGEGGAENEANRWNHFLNTFGLRFETNYNGISGVLSITSDHSILNGVQALYYNNGNSVSKLNPSTYLHTKILESLNEQGLLGIYDTCSSSITPTSLSHSSSAESGTVTVSAPPECSWTTTSNTDWATITFGNSGSGNGTVAYEITANPSYQSREGMLTIAGRIFTITQEGIECTYSISPPSKSHSSNTETGEISVSAPGDCPWTASSDISWGNITSGGTGEGNGTVTYAIMENTGDVRNGTFTIAGQTFTITQAKSGDIEPPVDEYQEGYNAGRQACIDDPASCGIIVDNTSIKLESDLSFHIPHFNYDSPAGLLQLWANFEFAPIDNRLLFEVVDFGVVTTNVTDKDGDGYSVEDGDCDDNNPNIHPGAAEIVGDGINQDCVADIFD